MDKASLTVAQSFERTLKFAMRANCENIKTRKKKGDGMPCKRSACMVMFMIVNTPIIMRDQKTR